VGHPSVAIVAGTLVVLICAGCSSTEAKSADPKLEAAATVAPAWGPASAPGPGTAATGASVAENEPGDSPIDLGEVRGAPVTGTVYYDANDNGVQDASEHGIAGVTLYLATSNTPAREETPATQSNAQGKFELLPLDRFTGRRLEVRTGWFRSQCKGLTCSVGGPGNNVAVGSEWIYSAAFTGQVAHNFNIGLRPDSGQYYPVKKNPNQQYLNLVTGTSRSHLQDLETRFTIDYGKGCVTTASAVTCHLGQTAFQTMYIGNGGLTSVSGVKGVIELPYGEVHRSLQLLASDTSASVTGVHVDSVSPALVAPATSQATSAASYTTIRFTLLGTIPPGGLVSVFSTDTLATGKPGTVLVGHAGITSEDNSAADTDSAFCNTPIPNGSCDHLSDTVSFLDLQGDDNDSDRLKVIS
jgi:hypothetical protein